MVHAPGNGSHLAPANSKGDSDYQRNETRKYKQGLKDRFGEEEGQAIIDYCESNTAPVKWDWEELEKMRQSFNRRIRELEKIV